MFAFECSYRDSRVTVVTISGLVVLWLAISFRFATRQELWMDETTQLSGLSLGPIEVVRWLLGEHVDRFGGIPGDRMPPVSYWLGWLWARLFGLSEMSLRILGLLLGGGALLFVYGAAKQLGGKAAAVVAGLTFALSPNVIVASVEVRAYPLLLLCSASACWFACHIICGSSNARSWTGMVLSLIVASYTHFFGVVLAGSLFTAIAWRVARLRAPGSLVAPIASALALALASIGLLPFVKGAARLEAQANTELATSSVGLPARLEVPRAAFRLVYRILNGHPALSVYLPLMIAGLTGTLVCLGIAVWCDRQARSMARTLASVVLVGLVVVLTCKIFVSRFDALSATYNLWMVPFVSVVAATSLAGISGGGRWAAWSAAALMLCANAGATAVLLGHASVFAHTPGDRLNARLLAAGQVSDTVVIHDGEGPWHHAYCPLQFAYGRRLRQYVYRAQPNAAFTVSSLPDAFETTELDALRAKRVLLVSFAHQPAAELARFIRTKNPPEIDQHEIESRLLELGWTLRGHDVLVAQGVEVVDWLEKPK